MIKAGYSSSRSGGSNRKNDGYSPRSRYAPTSKSSRYSGKSSRASGKYSISPSLINKYHKYRRHSIVADDDAVLMDEHEIDNPFVVSISESKSDIPPDETARESVRVRSDKDNILTKPRSGHAYSYADAPYLRKKRPSLLTSTLSRIIHSKQKKRVGSVKIIRDPVPTTKRSVPAPRAHSSTRDIRGKSLIRRLKRKNFYYGRVNLYKLLVNISAVLLLTAIAFFLWGLLNPSKKTEIKLADLQAFRIPHKTVSTIGDLSVKYGIDFYEFLTLYSLDNSFFPTKAVTPETYEIEQKYIFNYESLKKKYKSSTLERYEKIIESVFEDIKYFPIASYTDNYDTIAYVFSDSWGVTREYGSLRTHEGTDIIDKENIRGRLPVVSMTDGTVKDLGWNELGGYYIGITSANGNYYYYAHLDSFAMSVKKDTIVTAGQLIAYMGDSGYSKSEGTTGNMIVHTHVGIAPKTSLFTSLFKGVSERVWINPYPFLRYYESSKISVK